MAALFAAVYIYLKHPKFADPEVTPKSYGGKFYDGQFHNPVEQPLIVSEESRAARLAQFLFGKDQDAVPDQVLPSVKTNLFELADNENAIVWMGHSTYFLQLDGIRFLVDPVFSHNASPVPMTNTAFDGANIYSADDIPEIDYLLISHDHWDHLDYPTVTALKGKIKQVVAPIGVGSYFKQWGYNPDQIHEGDWYDSFRAERLDIHILPAQHFSGRLLERNHTLWGSFAIITPNHKIYLGGDSGYGPHFKEISQRLGAFDIAILENGQYNKDWPYIHMSPEETAQAALDLQAKAILPAHNSKFKLSHHSWYEPLERISQLSEDQPYHLLTPLIGETVDIDDSKQIFPKWWEQTHKIGSSSGFAKVSNK